MKYLAILVAAMALGCTKDTDSASKAASGKEPHASLVGIWPKDWTCDRIGTPEEIGHVLTGAARLLDAAAIPPDGVPRPCNYLVDVAAGTQPWTFDLDCRDGYKQRADALFAQYTRTSGELVVQYNQAADAGLPVDPDAGPYRAPEDAHEVPVGAKGLDHHGQGLLFIDDDAPCYVRVVGPDADRRLALAQYVVNRLTLATAPMTPRAAP
jgi:hypothetical protein